MKIIAQEKLVKSPIANPETTGVSSTFEYRGKVDLVLEKGGDVILRDWKTVANVEQAKRQRMLSFQSDLYALALAQEGIHIDAVEFCLIAKPTIKLCGKDKTAEDSNGAATYEDRCLTWLAQDGKLDAFEVPVTTARILSAKAWLWDISKQILDCRINRRFVCNEKACYAWQRECEYMPLCLAKCYGHDWASIVDADYESKPLHSELGEGAAGDKDVITYSSASQFALCQRKYEWRHQMGLKPKAPEDSEALNIGIDVHAGLEAAFLDGLGAGLEKVNIPVLHLDEKGLQNKAKARAMIRAAFEKWGRI